MQPEMVKKFDLNGIRTHCICDISTVLYQLRNQPNREPELWERSVPMDGKDRKVSFKQCKTAWLAQLVERQSPVRGVEGSTGPTFRVLK